MINKVMLIGNLGKDAEIKTIENGMKLANLSVATSENYKDKAGQWQEKTEWHNVTCWGQLADKAESLSKGTTIYLEGKLATRKYDKDGETRYKTGILANYFRVIKRGDEPKPASEPKAEHFNPDDIPF